MLFRSYTGNAMLNNALMTVEALGRLANVTGITPKLLLSLYEKHDLKSLNARLKSYTMIFTRNGPLYNDSKNGLKIYDGLMKELLTDVEIDGEIICEISGLKFNTSFEDIYKSVLKDIEFSEKGIDKKDTTINRGWFPLIGGLGSDAQALPQAKFTIQIHPICIAIMQFLPMSALLYKRGILLIDSINFQFARRFVAQNVNEVQKRIQTRSVKEPIENINEFSKGNYLLHALQILEDKNLDERESDLNLWSFSNSGTGASCEIDRIPSSTLKKLINLRTNVVIKFEVDRILSDKSFSDQFLVDLEANTEWQGLYPAVFGSGKKRFEYSGVSVEFLEAYFKEIDSPQKLEYGRFLAYLIDKYKTPSFQKYLSKTDAWRNEKDFKTDLFAVLVCAARHGEWDLWRHCEILDAPDDLPIRNSFYNIHRIAHFHFQKSAFNDQMPKLGNNESLTLVICKWLISLIQQDEKKDGYFVRNFVQDQNYSSVNYLELLIRSAKFASVRLDTVLTIFFNHDLKMSAYHVNDLMRIYFNQSEVTSHELASLTLPATWANDLRFIEWNNQLLEFVNDYQTYYLDKYANQLTGNKPYGRLLTRIHEIPNDARLFMEWLIETVENVNQYKHERNSAGEKWTPEDLLYNPVGELSIPLARFALTFLMHKHYHLKTSIQTEHHSDN